MEHLVYIPDEAKPDEKDVKVQISQWLFKPGDTIEKGVELVEVCTDKAVYVITAPVTGTLCKILIEEGQFFSPENPICIINIEED